MTNSAHCPPTPGQPLARPEILRLLSAALTVQEWRYARSAARAWLAAFPGDLDVQLLHARALLAEGARSGQEQALCTLKTLTSTDPENTNAWLWLTAVQRVLEMDTTHSEACTAVLAPGHSLTGFPAWAPPLAEARRALQDADNPRLKHAEILARQASAQTQDSALAAVTHLRIVLRRGELPPLAVSSLAQAYHQRWPLCLQFILALADSQMNTGSTEQAVALLHQAVSMDVAGQVMQRLWGASSPYRSLWPDSIEIAPGSPLNPQNIPIPAAVSAALGWNQLATGLVATPPASRAPKSQPSAAPYVAKASPPCTTETLAPLQGPAQPVEPPSRPYQRLPQRKQAHTVPDALRPIQKDLQRIASRLKQPHLAHLDGRFPVYVIFSTRLGLQKQYGLPSAQKIEEQLQLLAQAVRGSRTGYETWGAALLLADDPRSTAAYHLKPAVYNDPWSLKLLLADLDQELEQRGERIGAVLIVGGPEIVPFHHLANPVDDADQDIPSDNPYATRDENYFVPEWPVGRLPGGSANDPEPLLQLIRAIAQRHTGQHRHQPLYRRWWLLIQEWLSRSLRSPKSSFGYTAAVWWRASLSVFRSIGEPHGLLVSPPVQACEGKASPGSAQAAAPQNGACLQMRPARLGYFNLHGLPDAAEWYGQRDPLEAGSGPDFPIALRPQDVVNGGRAPLVVFSEACYGAHIYNKKVDEAISLKFLCSGSQAVVGSTCISYGSISTPLMAADLLGRVFWGFVSEGLPTGEALRRAKLHLVREMHRRQGFLDGEDQKTLVSFVLYGDPLALPVPTHKAAKAALRPLSIPAQIKQTCGRSQANTPPAPVSPELISHVRQVVSKHLPGMADAEMHARQAWAPQKNACHDCHCSGDCPSSHPAAKTPAAAANREVITLRKSIAQADLVHHQYAHLTMDKSGKLYKLVVSR